jgi:hypothetical protein
MDLVEKVWVACAIDTEGTIVAAPSNSLRILVSNINPDFCEHVRKLTGIGSVGIHDKTQKHIIYAWRLFDMRKIHDLLIEIMPWMIVKRSLAEIACKYVELRLQPAAPYYGQHPYTKEELSLLNKLRIRKHVTI